MLALTRRKGESIIINHDIEIVVLGTQGEQVKLGFNAPRNIPIHRKEIYDLIQAENLAASESVNIAALKDFQNKQNKEEQ